jgi:hypothetical protein
MIHQVLKNPMEYGRNPPSTHFSPLNHAVKCFGQNSGYLSVMLSCHVPYLTVVRTRDSLHASMFGQLDVRVTSLPCYRPMMSS